MPRLNKLQSQLFFGSSSVKFSLNYFLVPHQSNVACGFTVFITRHLETFSFLGSWNVH